MHKNNQEQYYTHSTTKNGSFLKMHHNLKIKGIKNNKFFLKIYDPKLIGVDPHDPNLNIETQARVLKEIIRNKWYFLREVVRIPVSGGDKPYQLHSGNLALTWCYINGISSYTELPRQNYKTISTIINLLHTFNFETKNSDFMFMNKKLDTNKKNLERFKDIRMLLPSYLRFNRVYTKAGTETEVNGNQTKITHPHNRNNIEIYASARSESAADNMGRGFTQTFQYYDEFAFTPFIGTIYAAASPAYSQAKEEAEANGKPYGKMITSTPGNVSDVPGAYALNFIGNAARFTEKLYDYTAKEIEEFIYTNSSNNFVYIRFTYKELGRDERWFDTQCRELNQDREKIRREVLLEWGVGNSASPFEPKHLELITKHMKTPRQVELLLKYYMLNIYSKYNILHPVMISVDGAEGLDNDSSAIAITDFKTGTLIASFKNNKIGIKNFSKVIYIIATKYFPNCIIVIERNKPGTMIIEELMDTNIEDRLYKHIEQDKTMEKFNNKGYVEYDVARRRSFGINTVSSNRHVMFDILQGYVEDDPEKFVGDDLVTEIKGLIRTNRGRIEAGPRTQDDLTMAYLIGEYVRLHGIDLSSYGLQKYMTHDERENILKEPKYINSELDDIITSTDSVDTSDLYNMLDAGYLSDKKKPKNISNFYSQMDLKIAKEREGISSSSIALESFINDINAFGFEED